MAITQTIAIVLYLLATWLMIRSVSAGIDQQGSQNQGSRNALLMAAAAAAFHFSYLVLRDLGNAGLNFNVSSMTAVVSGLLMLTFLLGCLGMQIARLGILLFPFTALSLTFSGLWGDTVAADHRMLMPITAFSAHVMVSIMAYALVAIAAIQATLFFVQERQIKSRTAPTMLMALPPLQTMQQLLFRLAGIGFVLLTLALISGALFSKEIYARPFEFNHHTILAILGWGVFAVMFFKRWRGTLSATAAVAWTVAGFVLIQLGYFGTKIITESLNLS